jgi:uncharacterized OsmC-like protein
MVTAAPGCEGKAMAPNTEKVDDAQRARLLEIANKCPVHRTLHAEVSIPTRLEQV